MHHPTPCELISWNGVYTLCRQLVVQIRKSGYQPEVIVAIGRGGYVPVRVLADHLDLMNLTSFKIEHYRGLQKGALARIKYPLAAEVRAVVLHHKTVSSFEPDYYAKKVTKRRWIIYPWAVMENLSELIMAMEPRPPSIEASAQRLQQEQGIHLSRKMLEDVLAFVQSSGGITEPDI